MKILYLKTKTIGYLFTLNPDGTYTYSHMLKDGELVKIPTYNRPVSQYTRTDIDIYFKYTNTGKGYETWEDFLADHFVDLI